MTIITTNLITDREYGSSNQRKRREEYIDHVGKKTYRQYIHNEGFDTAAKTASNIVDIDDESVQQEIAQAISLYETGGDPLYDVNGDKITPVYQTWEELATGTIRDFLHRTDMRDLAAIESVELTMSLVDRKTVYGMTAPQINAVDQDVNDAIAIRDQLAAYTPPYIEGVKQ
jgi:hypothetical protein